MRSAYLGGKCDIAVQRETPEWGSQLDNSSEKSERSQLLVSEHQCWHDPPTCCCSVASRLWLGHIECGKGCSVLTATLWWCIDDHSAIQLHSPPSDLKEFPDWTLWAQQLVVLHLIEMFSSTLFFPFEKKLYIVTVEKKNTLLFFNLLLAGEVLSFMVYLCSQNTERCVAILSKGLHFHS